jgi:hypothetical protein
MSNPSKAKGSGFEREVVARLQELGLAAEKQPLSGMLGGKYCDDIKISVPVLNCDKTIECKRRARAFSTIYGFLGSAYGLVLRDDRTPPLVVLRLEDFAALAKGQRATASDHQPGVETTETVVVP